MQYSPIPVTLLLPQLPMSFPRLCEYPDASLIFEESVESGGMRTVDKTCPCSTMDMKRPTNNGCTAFFFSSQASKRLD